MAKQMSRGHNASLVPETNKQVVHVRIGERLASTRTTELEKEMIGGYCFSVRVGDIVENEVDQLIGDTDGALRRRSFERTSMSDLIVVANPHCSSSNIDILQPEIEGLPDAKPTFVQEPQKQSIPLIMAGRK